MSFTMLRSWSSPTRNRTVTMDRSGSEVEYTYSTPGKLGGQPFHRSRYPVFHFGG